MRLTTELIQKAPTYINTLKEREIRLRGHKIQVIENLGPAKDNDCIDLSDNDVHVLGNFPLNVRLRTLLLARNSIQRIEGNLAESIPALTTLVLSDNRIVELADLDPLGKFQHLEYLTLVDNPVTSKENYRLWVVYRCPSVRLLDFKRVTTDERAEAKKLFGTTEAPTDLASKTMQTKSRTFELPTAMEKDEAPRERKMMLTAEEKKRLQEMILNAKDLNEMARLEKALAEGKMPAGVMNH